MLLWLDEQKKITAYNNYLSKKEAEQYLIDGYVIWVEGLKIEIPSYGANEMVEMHLTDENTINYVVVPAPVPELTLEERKQMNMEAGLEYLTCLVESSL